jgi:hypothetical protein
VLFPPDDSAAAQAYVAGIFRYPNFYQPSHTVIAVLEFGVEQGMTGKDEAMRFGRARLW